MAQQEVRIEGRDNRDFDGSNSGMDLISIVKKASSSIQFLAHTIFFLSDDDQIDTAAVTTP